MLSFSLSFSLSFALPFFLPTNNVYIYLYTHTYIHILHTHVHAYIDNSYVRCTYVRIFFRRILCEICLPLYSGRVADDDAKIGRSAFISSPFATFFHGRSILRVFPLPRHPSHVIFQKSDLRHLPKDAKIDSRYIYFFFFPFSPFIFLILVHSACKGSLTSGRAVSRDSRPQLTAKTKPRFRSRSTCFLHPVVNEILLYLLNRTINESVTLPELDCVFRLTHTGLEIGELQLCRLKYRILARTLFIYFTYFFFIFFFINACTKRNETNTLRASRSS